MSASKHRLGALMPAILLAATLGMPVVAMADGERPAQPSATVASTESDSKNSPPAPTTEPSVQEAKVKKDLGATTTTGTNKHGVPVKPVTAKQQAINKKAAQVANKVPGVHLKPADLQPPADDPPIKGFHPIKRALQPVVRLEKNSVQLQQQIMKLEGPIGALQPAMLGLHDKMSGVDKRMGAMQTQLTTTNESVHDVEGKMDGVRSDIQGMRTQIKHLEIPIRQLQKPLNELREPLASVSGPLQEVQKELSDMRALLATVLGAIVVAAIAISVGTPIAAILIYKHRRKLFPGLSDHDMPVAQASEKDPDKQPAHV